MSCCGNRALLNWRLKAQPIVVSTFAGEPEPLQGILGLFRVVRTCNSLQLRVGKSIQLSLCWDGYRPVPAGGSELA